MKHYLFALAGVVAATALASDPTPRPGDIAIDGFENYTAGASVTTASANWAGSGDATVRAYDNETAPSADLPPPFADSGSKYLEIDSGSDEVQRNFQGGTANNVYIDTLAQFSVLRAGETQPSAEGAKILLWLQEDNDNGTYSTNLYAKGGIFDDLTQPVDHTYKLDTSCQPGVWYRVTIQWYKTIMNEFYRTDGEDPDANDHPGFVIQINGVDVAIAQGEDPIMTSATLESLCPSINGGDDDEDGMDPDILALVQANKLIPAMGTAVASSSVSQVAFKGTGAIDNFVVSANNPSSFLLTWPAGLTSVSYVLGQNSSEDLTPADGSTNITAEAGTSITLTGSAGYLTKTVTTNVTAGGSLSLPPMDIDYFFPQTATADQDGSAENPYEIADVDDLRALQAAVSNRVGTGLCYVQKNNINMLGMDPFEGIGVYDANPTNGVPFMGTYDGAGFKILNVTFTDRDYAGIFNQVNGPGAILNLTVTNATFVGTGNKYSASIVGNAGNGATLQNLVAEGSFGLATKPGNHNMAGIVIRASGGGDGTMIKDCTNNAAIYGTYTKLGGICAITQHKVDGEAVTFDGCVNNGTLTMSSGSTAGRDGLAGIVAYSADDTALTNCVNAGTMSTTLANATNVAELVGYQQSYSLLDQGGNKADASKAMLGEGKGATVTGFQYATVESGVATTVLPPLAVGNTYLLEGNVAAAETAVATLAFGQTISFDTALGYTFDGNVAAEAPLVAIPSTSGTVITYTAGYFPRTATAGQDGTAEHPFEIADLDDLEALKAYVDTTNCANIAFVQTADIVMTNAWPGIGVDAGKDKTAEEYEAGAFAGTYDGGNYTISNFSMVNGIDYGGLFNSVYNTTIKNLKMSWSSSTLCSDSSSSGDDTGATFVGTAKGSTLQNLTALAGTVTTVSASKDMAGIVGYVYAGSTVESCTNYLNITSFKTSRKCGGIAIITQNGSGNAIFRNCYNSGTVTTPGTAYREGGIVGYVNVATTIDGCENTANVKLFHVEGSPIVTVTGTNKGYAGVASNDKGVSGLYFATVSGDVATFVADNALALNGEYKVMSTGATATFAFTAPGTISFDTNLVQAVSFAITAAEGLTLTDATANGVVTYTATGAGDDDYVVTINGSDVVVTPSAEDLAAVQAAVIAGGGTLDVTDVAAVNAALAAEIGSTGIPSWQALFLGLPPTEAGLESFKIASISFNGDGNVVVTLPAAVSPKTGRGVNIALNLMGSDDLSNWAFIEAAGGQDGKTFAPVVPASGETKKFYKVQAVFTATPAE